MNKIRVIRDFWKDDRHFLPGEFIKDELSKEEIKKRMDGGFLVMKVVVKKKPLRQKKVKSDKIS